jgi:hypothetical protein
MVVPGGIFTPVVASAMLIPTINPAVEDMEVTQAEPVVRLPVNPVGGAR